MRVKIRIDDGTFENIKGKHDEELEKMLLEKVAKLEKCVNRKNRKELQKKRDALWENVEKMRVKIKELEYFINRAKKDQKIMEMWIHKLQKENNILLKKLREIW